MKDHLHVHGPTRYHISFHDAEDANFEGENVTGETNKTTRLHKYYTIAAACPQIKHLRAECKQLYQLIFLHEYIIVLHSVRNGL
jgi:hypothetical protein